MATVEGTQVERLCPFYLHPAVRALYPMDLNDDRCAQRAPRKVSHLSLANVMIILELPSTTRAHQLRLPRFRRTHSRSRLLDSLISCRNTRYPGHCRIFLNSLSVTPPVSPEYLFSKKPAKCPSLQIPAERLEYNLLFRWFVGLSANEPVWHRTVCSKNRDRLLEGRSRSFSL